MGIIGIWEGAYGGLAPQSTTQNAGDGYNFAQIMEWTRSVQNTSSANAPRDSLDAKTRGYLDTFAKIYAGFAALYGDGFELKGKSYCEGDTEGEAAYMKYSAVRDAFRRELSAAGVPLAGADGRGGISALFYAEKYGLAGLSPEEQCAKVLGGLQVCSYREFSAAISLLYEIGAISEEDYKSIDQAALRQAVGGLGDSYSSVEFMSALDRINDWSEMLDTMDDGDRALTLLERAWAMLEEAEDRKLQAIYQKVDAQQEAIHEAIEYSIQKQRELELLHRALAESARLRIKFGLDYGLEVDTADLTADAAETLDIGL